MEGSANDTGDAEPAGLKIGVTLPILIMGTIGNILTLCVLFRSAFRGKTFAIFLRALAVADLIVMWIDPLTLAVFDPAFPYTTGELACRVYAWVFAMVSSASSWTLVLVTLERLVIVYRPHIAHLLVTEWRAVGVVIVLWLTFGTLGTYTFALSHEWQNHCTLSTTLTASELITFMCLYSLIPALVLGTCNVLIIMTVRRATRIRRSMSVKKAPTNPSTRMDRITLMLVTNSFAFVILTLPEILVYAVEFLRDERIPDAFVWIANFMRRLNHAINFFLYCTSGALFRKELGLMVRQVIGRIREMCWGWRSGEGWVASSSIGSGSVKKGYKDLPVSDGDMDEVDGLTQITSTRASTGV